VAAVSWLKYAGLAYFSQPRSEQQLYRLVKRRKVCRIVEIGIGSLERTAALVRVAQRYAANDQVSYTGIDWFDARTAELPALTLKQTHTRLQSTGAKTRLVPGEPGRSLATVANAHQHTGLMLISAAVADSSLVAAWFYVPRMLDDGSIVLREGLDAAGEPTFTQLSHQQIAALAQQSTRKRAA
jgi:hypothetical protein